MDWNKATLIFSLVGSVLSSISTSIALVLFGATLVSGQINIRTKLVINLLLAEWLNSTNNGISGIYGFFGQLTRGPACTANGFIGNWSVQAADLSVLLVVLVTYMALMTTTSTSFDTVMFKLDRNSHWMFLGMWLFPFLTSIIALVTVGYAPSSTNWCWIDATGAAGNNKVLGNIMRYSLIHGPRILIFLVIIVLYSILGWHLYSLGQSTNSNDYADSSEKSMTQAEELVKSKRKAIRSAILRLVAYPVAYILLWIPGIGMRGMSFTLII